MFRIFSHATELNREIFINRTSKYFTVSEYALRLCATIYVVAAEWGFVEHLDVVRVRLKPDGTR